MSDMGFTASAFDSRFAPSGGQGPGYFSAGYLAPAGYNSTQVFTLNQAKAGRTTIPRACSQVALSVFFTVSSGNIDVGIFDTGDALAASRTKLASTGSIACPAANTWVEVGTLTITGGLRQGQAVDLLCACDNTTASMARFALQVAAQGTLPASYLPATSALAKASYVVTTLFPLATVAEASCVTATAGPPAIIGRIVA